MTFLDFRAQGPAGQAPAVQLYLLVLGQGSWHAGRAWARPFEAVHAALHKQ